MKRLDCSGSSGLGFGFLGTQPLGACSFERVRMLDGDSPFEIVAQLAPLVGSMVRKMRFGSPAVIGRYTALTFRAALEHCRAVL
jgi:hypothetical protein